MSFNYKKYSSIEPVDALNLVNLFTENLGANMFVADKAGDIIYANANSANTYQCAMDELFTFNAYTMEQKGYTDRTPAVKEVLTGKKEIKRYIKTGRDVGMIISCKPIFDDNGEVLYAVATSYAEHDFLDLLNEIDVEKNKLRQAVDYLNKLSQKPMFQTSSNSKMKALYDLADKAAISDSVVMIYGASGTGKEVMASHIHSNSKRKNGPFIPINCAAIPAELMESEFFGYEKGSFTGANEKGKYGLFEVTSGGTLFLDEIGELTLPMQSKLLRVLESGEYRRIGSNKILKTNARIIGATNKELWRLVEEGSFRRDLYYRLNVIPISLPPLRERKEDILPLAYSFLESFNNKLGTKKTFSEETCKYLEKYPWPGNIRELRNVIERMVVVSNSNVITLSKEYMTMFDEGAGIMAVKDEEASENEHSDVSKVFPHEGTIQAANSENYALPFKAALRNFEKDYVTHVLNDCDGNISKAAKRLGLQRSSLYNIINRG